MRVPLVAIEDQSHRELSGTTRIAWARGGFLDFVRADSRRSFSAGWEFSLRLLTSIGLQSRNSGDLEMSAIFSLICLQRAGTLTALEN